MRRRDFLRAAGVAIFAPQFGRWYRRGSGLVVPEEGLYGASINEILKELYRKYPPMLPRSLLAPSGPTPRPMRWGGDGVRFDVEVTR